MFLIEITIQVSFTSCCTAKKEKGSNGFFPKIFFSLAQLSYEYISLGFFAGFLFFLLACFLCFLGFCSLVVVFFFGTSGSKTKTLFLFLLLVLFSFGYFFSFQYSCSLLVKKNCGVWQNFLQLLRDFWGLFQVVAGFGIFFFGELDLIFFGHFLFVLILDVQQ